MSHKQAAPMADICLLLEGTWPYVRGGVSSWIHQMILGLPELTFSVMFIGGQRSAYSQRRYQVPANVLHIEEVFLEDATHPTDTRGTPRDADLQQLQDLYRFLHHPDAPEPELGERLLDNIAQGRLTLDDVLRSRASWEALSEGYRLHCADPSFINYFWTLRSMQSPLLMLAEAAQDASGAGAAFDFHRLRRAVGLHSQAALELFLPAQRARDLYQGAQDRSGPGQLDRREFRPGAEPQPRCRLGLHPYLMGAFLRAHRATDLQQRRQHHFAV
jgi:hypothetical protein